MTDYDHAVFLILSTRFLSAKGGDGYIIETQGPLAAAEVEVSHHTSDNALVGMVPGHGLWVLTCRIDANEKGVVPLITEVEWRTADVDEVARMVKGETPILAPPPEVGGRRRPCPPTGVPWVAPAGAALASPPCPAWKPRVEIPIIKLTWACSICGCNQDARRDCRLIPMPGDQDDLVLCASCDTPENEQKARWDARGWGADDALTERTAVRP